ncbi:MAG TPA: type II secretion system protein GspM [Bryobacteraceae bacterium]|nr:type II secretion system protein GspM [Bryobacteraceae bacterium]
MTLQDRDKRALLILAVVLPVAVLIYWTGSSSSSGVIGVTKVVAPAETVERDEKRIAVLRKALATVDGKEAVLKQVSTELAEREKGLIPGDTPEQAQAQLLQIMRRLAKAQVPALDIRQTELGQPRSYGESYARVTVSVNLECRVDDLLNLLAALNAQPEIIATDEIRCGAANPKSKSMPVRLTVSGLVPRRLVPEKKGMPAL